MKTRTFFSLLSAGVISTFAAPLSAQILTPNNPVTPHEDVNSLTVGVNGNQGYDIQSNGSAVASLPSYISAVAFTRYFTLTDSTHITLDGTSYQTGFSYNGATATPTALATITLGSNLPASFTVGILTDAAGPGFGTAVNTLFTAQVNDSNGIYGSTLVLPVAVNAMRSATRDLNNDFYSFTVSGLTSADEGRVIVISGANPGGSYDTLEGVSFSVPEPSTYVLMFLGLGSLLVLARARRTTNRV